jgi:dCTP diphosphatase
MFYSQWKGEVEDGLPDFSDEERVHVAEELSDVLIYLIRLADKCHVDLPKAAIRKMELNAKKYPAEKVRGSSKKYTEYKQESLDTTEGDQQ